VKIIKRCFGKDKKTNIKRVVEGANPYDVNNKEKIINKK